MSKRNKIITGVIIAVVIVGGLLVQTQQSTAQKNAVKKTTVQKGTLKQNLSLSGEVDAKETVTLRFQTSGRLSSVAVKEGDYVKKGQFIASLDKRELTKQLQKDLNTFRTKRSDLDQQRDDYEGSAITEAMQRVLEKAQIGVDNAVLDVELQSIVSQYASLISPIEGYVTRVTSPYSGVNITPAQAEFEIVNPNSLYFLVTADQTEVTQIRRDMSAKIVLDSFEGKEFSGNLKYISYTPKTGESNTVYSVDIFFDAPKNIPNLRIGMTGDADLIVNEKRNATYIPINYLKNDAKGDYVNTMQNNRQIRTGVKAGMETDEYVEILSGVHAGDTIYD